MRVLVRASTAALLVSSFAAAKASDGPFLVATSLSPIIQNERADEEGMARMVNDRMLTRYVRSRLLVRVPAETRTYYLKGIPARYRYLRPQSRRFLDTVSRDYFAEFGKRLRVTSLVRTGQLQLQLAGYNGNAAPATGPTRSSHLTGATLDISKSPMGPEEREWMRSKILDWAESDYLYGIEEHAQPTFHIMVYKTFPETGVRAVELQLAKAPVRRVAKGVRSKGYSVRSVKASKLAKMRTVKAHSGSAKRHAKPVKILRAKAKAQKPRRAARRRA